MTTKTMNKNEYDMKAGWYFIGDPCYAIAKEDWIRFLDARNASASKEEFEFDGEKVMVFETYQGDGTYSDQDDNTYDVDSGLIGCIPISLVKRVPNDIGDCYIECFNRPFDAYETKGEINIGFTTICTRRGY